MPDRALSEVFPKWNSKLQNSLAKINNNNNTYNYKEKNIYVKSLVLKLHGITAI